MNSSSNRIGFEPAYSTLDEWIIKESIPFSLDSSAAFNNAIDWSMNQFQGSMKLLGLGEAMHGNREILLLRNRVFFHLVKKHGFRAIAIESSFPRGRLVDEYINGRGPASYEEIQDKGFSHGFGCLDANQELVEWMKEYNSDPSHTHKLHFYGFDSPTEMMESNSPRQLLHFVFDYLNSIGIASGEAFRMRIDPFIGQDSDWNNPDALIDPEKSIGRSNAAAQLRCEVEDLMAELLVQRPELVAKSDCALYQEAVQYATLARQLLNYHAALAKRSDDRVSRLLGLRDAMMADNLAYIVSKESSCGRVLAFAHNRHLQRGQAEWKCQDDLYSWWPAGSHLHQIMGPGYAVIGTAVGIFDHNGIGRPEEDTLEAKLTSAPGPLRLIPTCKGVGLPDGEIASLPIRSGSTKNPTYFPLSQESFADFDWLMIL